MQTIAYASPIGILYLTADEDGITCVTGHEPADLSALVSLSEACPLLQKAEGQLREYFAGKRETFDLPLKPAGTAFQQKVWRALTEIPYGVTRTYGEIAQVISQPSTYVREAVEGGPRDLTIYDAIEVQRQLFPAFTLK